MTTSPLPHPFRGWADELDFFQDDVRSDLLTFLPSLEKLLTPRSEASSSEAGTPNGVDGVERRGLLPALLPSQWALLRSLPLEFVRRFHESELLYKRRAFEDKSSSRDLLVLVDCGPGMLGVPRIVALAALLILERQSRLRSGKFRFASLQGETVHAGIDAASVKAFLDAKTWQKRSLELDESWKKRLASSELLAASELFVVGQEFETTWRCRQIRVREVFTNDESRKAQVVVREKGGSQHERTLRLPNEARCVALLRRPFAQVATSATSTRPARPVRVSHEDFLLNTLATQAVFRSVDENGQVLDNWLYHVKPNGFGGARRTTRFQHRVVACGGPYGNSPMLVLTENETELQLWELSKVITSDNRRLVGVFPKQGFIREQFPDRYNAFSWGIEFGIDPVTELSKHPSRPFPPLPTSLGSIVPLDVGRLGCGHLAVVWQKTILWLRSTPTDRGRERQLQDGYAVLWQMAEPLRVQGSLDRGKSRIAVIDSLGCEIRSFRAVTDPSVTTKSLLGGGKGGGTIKFESPPTVLRGNVLIYGEAQGEGRTDYSRFDEPQYVPPPYAQETENSLPLVRRRSLRHPPGSRLLSAWPLQKRALLASGNTLQFVRTDATENEMTSLSFESPIQEEGLRVEYSAEPRFAYLSPCGQFVVFRGDRLLSMKLDIATKRG